MNFFRLLCVTVLLTFLVACGGGGSSSDESSSDTPSGENPDGGAGGDNGGGGNPDTVDLNGAYIGTQNLVLSLGGISETANIEANVTVSGNSSILIDPLSANGSIANNTFVATTNRTSTQGGLTCQFLLTYRGDISSESLSGDISGTAICDQGSGNETLNVTGTISANRS